jgi:4-carboxymuconolactone decarboxylase
MASNDHFELGRKIRTDVLGSKRVKGLLDDADDFNRPLQELVTEYCWGKCWGSEGLDRKQRSLLNLGMLAVLNRPTEFSLHFEAAIGNGLTLKELRDVLIQVTIYCGVPAGIEVQRLANTVIANLREAGDLQEADFQDLSIGD